MHTSTTLIRFRRLLLVGAVVAGAIVPAAAAVGRPPDVQDAATANLATLISRPPDVQDAASATTVAVADAFERYTAAHPYGIGLSSTSTSVSRPPDVEDTALAVRYGSVIATSTNGFDWNDWAIGIGSGIGLALFLVGGLLMGRQLRQRVQTV